MFNLFRKKTLLTNQSENVLNNPTYLFSQMGPAMKQIWDDMNKGENTAVDQYAEFVNYIKKLNLKYDSIDFMKTVFSLENENKDKIMDISTGEVMYLAALGFEIDVYLSDENESDVFLLSKERYLDALGKLSKSETEYCDQIVNYFKRNIVSKVNEVSRIRWNKDICKYPLPINNKTCRDYHIYIASEEYNYTDGEQSKWNYIINAPIYEHKTSKANPITPVNINSLNAFVIDALCYINMAIPTLNLIKILRYRDAEKSTMQSIIEAFGEGVDMFIFRSISDYSCAEFRKWLTLGLKTK